MHLPIWEPSQERVERANMSRFMRFVREQTGIDASSAITPLYDFSIRSPEKFWPLVWEFCGIRATGEFEPVLVDAEQDARRALLSQRQAELRAEPAALSGTTSRRWSSATSGATSASTAMPNCTSRSAASRMRSSRPGSTVGDRVAGFMPNMPETVIAMLATASLGAIWSSCSPDFGINGVVDRFGQIEPKVLFCADAYPYGGKTFACLDKVRGVLDKIDSIEKLVVIPYSGETPDLPACAMP